VYYKIKTYDLQSSLLSALTMAILAMLTPDCRQQENLSLVIGFLFSSIVFSLACALLSSSIQRWGHRMLTDANTLYCPHKWAERVEKH
jgi:uncharacterized metal-binding protein